MIRSPGSPLARYLFVAYTVLVVYASLHPLHGWTPRGANPLAFLFGPLPRQFTLFDVAANGLAYVPFGALCVLALYPRWRGISSAVVATLAGALLSASLEALQTYLPSRVASNLDFWLNVSGTLAGAVLGAVAAPRALGASNLVRRRRRWFRSGPRIDVGIVLIALWLFAQLHPGGLLFGTGKIPGLLEGEPSAQLSAELFVRAEATVSAAHLIALGLFVGVLVHPRRPIWAAVIAIVTAGLAVRSIAFATLFAPKSAFNWVTPGAWRGVVFGALVLLLVSRLGLGARVAIATFMLIAATVLVNVAPNNPYTTYALQVWPQGHFLNFHGLTAIVSMLWPWLALIYLITLVIAIGRAAPRTGD